MIKARASDRGRISASATVAGRHRAAGPFPASEKAIGSWEPVPGSCCEIGFEYPAGAEFLTLSSDVFGAEKTVVGFRGRGLPFEAQVPGAGRTRPTYWTDGRALRIPVGDQLEDWTQLRICAPVIDAPERPGDIDDFRIRNVSLRVN